jgi:LPPG:FO 2-phospho-L-lactate transferase
VAGLTVLAGGTGGAKLARGLLDAVGDDLTVIANPGDDVEIYGAYVSPDPDLVTFWLADVIDERGWGLRGDTFGVMDGLRALGDDVWFNLGDRDLAWCARRARRLAEGATPTIALEEAARALGVRARVLPVSDDPVRTWVLSAGEWQAFQEFMVRGRAAGAVEGMEVRGAQAARPTEAVLAAIAEAEAIVIGPSNPVASIGPMLAVPGLRDALRDAPAPVVAVSPFVGGQVLKGPTEAFMRWAGYAADAEGVAALYGDLLDGFVCDDEDAELDVPALLTDTLLDTPAARERVAGEVLHFARGLA